MAVDKAKSLPTKVVAGKRPLFLGLPCAAYVSSIIHKVLYAHDWVILLYGLNTCMVATDLFLCLKHSTQTSAAAVATAD